MDLNKIWSIIIDWLVNEGVKLVIATIVLYILFKIVNVITRRVEKKLYAKKETLDETITRIVISTIRKVVKFIIFVCFLGYVGIETTSIAAAITSTGLAIGLALQGSLSNFAGGVIILIMRPYKIGDYIECNEESGTVDDIKLFYTYIRTIDNKVVIIPNGKMADSSITNYSSKKVRRLDMIFKVAYKNDIEKAKEVILKSVINSNNYKSKPEPFVNVDSYRDSSIDIVLKVWCDNSEYWNLYYYLQEEVKKQFDANGIEVAFKQLNINIK